MRAGRRRATAPSGTWRVRSLATARTHHQPDACAIARTSSAKRVFADPRLAVDDSADSIRVVEGCDDVVHLGGPPDEGPTRPH